MSTAATAGAQAAQQAIAQAIKASGVLVKVLPKDFQAILNKQEQPLIVYAVSKFFSTTHKYMNSYKGLSFYCESDTELMLPAKKELVFAKKIWIPG